MKLGTFAMKVPIFISRTLCAAGGPGRSFQGDCRRPDPRVRASSPAPVAGLDAAFPTVEVSVSCPMRSTLARATQGILRKVITNKFVESVYVFRLVNRFLRAFPPLPCRLLIPNLA